jgi:8-oxo-dGTP diphosphatase
MLREVWEETGLTVTEFCYRGIVTFVSDRDPCEYMHLFTCSDWTGEMKECNEGDLEWIDKRALYDLTLWEGDRVFLKLLEKDIPFFSLKLVYEGDKLVKTVLNGKEVHA